MNKKQLALLLMMLLYGVSICFARGDDVINLQHVGNHEDHSEYFPPADMPEVYYDDLNYDIIIVADGFASYYDVDIISQSTQLAVISTQIDGYGVSQWRKVQHLQFIFQVFNQFCCLLQ